MSKAKMVLMVGGPADGRWMVPYGRDFVVAEPATIDWMNESSAVSDIKQIRYRVDTFAVFGFAAKIAVAEGEFRSSAERSKAIVRALFQRDVAQAMGAFE